MEKKRKLPARAAARVEHVSKKRTVTPPDNRASATPAPELPAEEAPPPLPSSVQAGKALPTVDSPQSWLEEMPSKEYQSIQESGVLSESLQRSRQKWISEGIFEKYWSKPTKKKGVVTEAPNNPSKDTMVKLGQVTITVEPHVFEATMFAIKDTKQPPLPQHRPVLQYGPPNGSMPPPPTPKGKTSTPAPSTATTAPASAPQTSHQTSQTAQEPVAQTPKQATSQPLANPSKPAPSPRGPEPVPSPSPGPAQASPKPAAPTNQETPNTPQLPPPAAAATNAQPTARPQPSPASNTKPPVPPNATPSPAQPVASPAAGATNPAPPANQPAAAGPPGTDPIIVTLAERASEDPQLRDLMKRVAVGDARPEELKYFQSIIDQITAEKKRIGTPQGPSADRLIVDGRTVKFFANEVRAILDIVLRTNPKQTGTDLRPPPGSDALVVLLVKEALDHPKTADRIRRIAEGRPQFSDATDLKSDLDWLKKVHIDGKNKAPQTTATFAPADAKPNGASSGHPPASAATPAQQQTPQPSAPAQQALRSKGPPPAPKPEYSAVVFEFSGGSGDRYLFPKFSILEYLPGGNQVIASFLIARRGSFSEYGGDPDKDYYQPVTIRLYTHTGRHLEHLARVVAPVDEVKRYMDDVMDNMTRAEYVLLAMQLPHSQQTMNGGSASTKPALGANQENREMMDDSTYGWFVTTLAPKPEAE